MKNRLKLYDDLIYTYINKKDKIKFRKLAFKNNMSVSEFNRYLIKLFIKMNECSKANLQKEEYKEQLNKIACLLGGIFNQ